MTWFGAMWQVIAAIGGNNPALAARAATSAIPIVSVFGSDPIKLGLVANLRDPGTNVTGVSLLASDLVAKRFELLSELIGNLPTIGFIINSDNPNAKPATVEAQIWGRTSGRQIIVARASTEGDLESAFAALVQSVLAHLLSARTDFSPHAANNSLDWRPVTPCPVCFRGPISAEGWLRRGQTKG